MRNCLLDLTERPNKSVTSIKAVLHRNPVGGTPPFNNMLFDTGRVISEIRISLLHRFLFLSSELILSLSSVSKGTLELRYLLWPG